VRAERGLMDFLMNILVVRTALDCCIYLFVAFLFKKKLNIYFAGFVSVVRNEITCSYSHYLMNGRWFWNHG
jgi:hypothetical protein